MRAARAEHGGDGRRVGPGASHRHAAVRARAAAPAGVGPRVDAGAAPAGREPGGGEAAGGSGSGAGEEDQGGTGGETGGDPAAGGCAAVAAGRGYENGEAKVRAS